jgi:diaminopimelate epimerase
VSLARWDAQGNVYLVTEAAELYAEDVREQSAGADGILQVLAHGDDWVDVRIWNPDGSTAELSGNGTRIAARWLADRTGAERVVVGVGTREVVARMLGGADVEQELGAVEVGPLEVLYLDGEPIVFSPVSVGNPHAVVRRQPDRDELLRIGPQIERHPRFPDRTNVQLAIRTGPGEVRAVVWERGAGETASSGTSAVAVAAAVVGEGTTVVHFPGGDLHVRIERGQAFLTGPAVAVGGS